MEEKDKAIPATEMKEKKIPAKKTREKKLPVVGNAENTVIIGGQMIEIKPTKLKYHRNNTAAFYKIVDMLPLPDIMMMDSKAFGDGRDGDKALMDWLVAATDNPELIHENYNEMDSDVIEKILSIFKRVNRIDEKEEKQKNAESRMQKA